MLYFLNVRIKILYIIVSNATSHISILMHVLIYSIRLSGIDYADYAIIRTVNIYVKHPYKMVRMSRILNMLKTDFEINLYF